MKNLTIKKIALGVFLAGYTASGAFAVVNYSQNYIMGSRPIIGAPTNNASPDITVTLQTAGGTAIAKGDEINTGDKIIVSYSLKDANGDSEALLKSTAKTLRFYASIPTVNSGAFEMQSLNPDTDLAIALANENNTVAGTATGIVTYTIPASWDGATRIGLIMTAHTDYGIPRTGNSVWYNDIFAPNGAWPVTPPTDPTEETPVDPTEPGGVTPNTPDPGKTDPTDPETPHGPDAPGPTPENPVGGKVKLFILDTTASTGIGSIATGSALPASGITRIDKDVANTIYPTLGEKYTAVVVKGSTNIVQASYKYDFGLVDTNTKAIEQLVARGDVARTTTAITIADPGNAASTVLLTGFTTVTAAANGTATITLNAVNTDTMYNQTYNATTNPSGAQGYKLHVYATK